MSSNVAITVPGDIPGLIQRGATVRYYGYRCVVVTDPCYGVMLLSDGVSLVKSSVHFVSLDLSHPTGRDIAARWIAEKLGMKVGLTAPVFDYIDGAVTGGPSGWSLEGHADSSGFFRAFISTPAAKPLKCDVVIPGLPLDPDQGVEALRLCVLHLAGRL